MMSQSESVTDILIRNAIIDESSAIASVLHRAFIEYEPLYTPDAFAVTTPSSDQIRDRWNEGPVWAALQKEDLVGTVAAIPRNSGLYVRSMAILPVARGQGIARQMLNEIERFAITHHHRRLFLSTTPFLKQAIRLYEDFGFERSNEGPYDLLGTPLVTMTKPLAISARAPSDE